MQPVPQPAPVTRFGAIRASFAGASQGPYMDVSARSLLYAGARAALDSYLDANATGRLDKTDMFAAVEKTRSLFAQLIGADADEIAYTRNVTDGIATLAASLPWQKGDNVVLCETIGRSLGLEHDPAGDERMRDLYAYLVANNVHLSIRRDLLRFSLHIYNNEDDVAQVVDLVRRWNRR
jgi:selenocysteine lyase/cysteine desulfurase